MAEIGLSTRKRHSLYYGITTSRVLISALVTLKIEIKRATQKPTVLQQQTCDMAVFANGHLGIGIRLVVYGRFIGTDP